MKKLHILFVFVAITMTSIAQNRNLVLDGYTDMSEISIDPKKRLIHRLGKQPALCE